MTIRHVDDLAADVPLLADLEPSALAQVAGCASLAHFSRGDYLAREGAPADTFFALRRGHVALQLRAPARGIVIETLGEGQVCGWSWLVAPYQWQFDVRALESVDALVFDATCLRGKIEADDALGYALLRRFAPVMLERLQHTRLRLIDVYGNPAG
jgi:CRP/FNR family cyclic AMP-dependent transcriptional regulator